MYGNKVNTKDNTCSRVSGNKYTNSVIKVAVTCSIINFYQSSVSVGIVMKVIIPFTY